MNYKFILFCSLATLHGQVQATDNHETSEPVKIEFFDRGHFSETMAHTLHQRYTLDREYINGMLKTMNGLEDTLIADETDLKKVSDRSHLNPISVEEFTAAVNRYEHSVQIFNSRLISYSSALQSQHNDKGNKHEPVPPDFNQFVSLTQNKITLNKAALDKLVFEISLPSGELFHQNGLDFTKLRGKKLYTAAQISKMKEQEKKLRIMPHEDRNRLNQTYNRFTLEQVKNFIQVFGASQRYRTQENQAGLERALEHLQEAFWTRSYLRATFGIKIGSFAIDYHKQILNFDFFGSNHLKFNSQFLYNENDLVKMQDLTFNALATHTGKTVSILKLETPIFSRISSAMTYFAGERQEAQANALILKLLANDTEEELTLSKVGGLKAVRAAYRARYYDTAKNQKYFKDLSEKYLPSHDGTDIEQDLHTVDADTLWGVFNACLHSLENYELRLHEADKLRNSINYLSEDNQMVINRKKRQEL
jgi:hypothetical protein